MNHKRTFQKRISYFKGKGCCESAGARSAGRCGDSVSDCGEANEESQNGDPELPDESAPAHRSPKSGGVREAPSFPHDLLHDPERWREDYGRLPGHVMPDVFFRNGCLGAFRNAEMV